jgi:hypothetical protein
MKRGGGERGNGRKGRGLCRFSHSPTRPVAQSGFTYAVVILLTFADRREIFREAVAL